VTQSAGAAAPASPAADPVTPATPAATAKAHASRLHTNLVRRPRLCLPQPHAFTTRMNIRADHTLNSYTMVKMYAYPCRVASVSSTT
jgi:hypothetical protein